MEKQCFDTPSIYAMRVAARATEPGGWNPKKEVRVKGKMCFVVLQDSDGRQNSHTRRVEDYLTRADVEFESWSWSNAFLKAYVLRVMASGRFGCRQRDGFPLVILTNEQVKVVWACCQPTRSQLRRAIKKMELANEETPEAIAV